MQNNVLDYLYETVLRAPIKKHFRMEQIPYPLVKFTVRAGQ